LILVKNQTLDLKIEIKLKLDLKTKFWLNDEKTKPEFDFG
jgi:hypothetical protein